MYGKNTVLSLVNDDLMASFRKENERLDRIDRWSRWEQDDAKLPRSATPELKQLRDLAKTPWLALVVTTVAQALFADGYRASSEAASKGPWGIWLANGFDHRQIGVHRAALTYGYSFVTTLPGEDANGPTAVLRGVSPRKMIARYADPASDDWPEVAMYVHRQPDRSYLVDLHDDVAVHHLLMDSNGENVTYVSFDIHDAGVVPVTKYSNMLDLDGRSPGEIEPYIPLAGRINKTVMDRLLTQHFASWKVRWIAGMAAPDDRAATERALMQLRQDDILTAEDADTKFGTLDESPIDPFINATKADVQALAAATQTPTHNLTGDLINVSAEGLAAMRASLTQKVYERQKSFGKSHAQALRLGSHFAGDTTAASDSTGRITWQDTSIRSMTQAVDALGKMAQMLGVPPEALWGKVPGVEQSDVEEWKRLAEAADPVERMRARLDSQIQDALPPAGDDPDGPAPRAGG